MGEYSGSIKVRGEAGDGLRVVVDLADESVLIKSEAGILGRWPLGDVGVRGEDDGFHLRIEGEELIFETDADVDFAFAIGLQSASPRLRRRMSAALRD